MTGSGARAWDLRDVAARGGCGCSQRPIPQAAANLERSSVHARRPRGGAETPLSLVLADTVGISSSDYLLEHITTQIRDSASCIFDATGANANVSLEVGIAHTIPVDSPFRMAGDVFTSGP